MKVSFVIPVVLAFFLCCPGIFSQSLSEGQRALEVGSYTQALQIISELAQKNDNKAQFLLGSMYETGTGVTQDNRQAFFWIFLAAQQDGNLLKYLEKIGKSLSDSEQQRIKSDCQVWLEKHKKTKTFEEKDEKKKK